MRKLVLLLAVFFQAGGLLWAQIDRISSLMDRHHLDGNHLVAAYFPGPEVPSGHWATPGWNLMLQSGDLTGWSVAGTPVVTATTAEDDSTEDLEYIVIAAAIAAANAVAHTWTIWVLKDAITPATRFPMFALKVLGEYRILLDTATGASNVNQAGLGGSRTVTSDVVDGQPCWKLVMSFTTDDALGIALYIYPARGANADLTTLSAAAVGTITVLKQQLSPGSTVREYQATTTKQSIPDRSGKGNHAVRGTNGTVQTADGTWAVRSRNLLAPGSAILNTNASWTKTDATAGATTITFTAQNGRMTQPLTTIAGAFYRACADIQRSTGNTALTWMHTDSATGDTTAVTIDGTLTRRCLGFLGKAGGGTVTFGLQDTNAAGQGVVTATNWQIEQVAASDSPASPFTNPSNPTVQGLDLDGVDDTALGTFASLTASTVVVLARVESFANQPDLYSNGNAATEVYINTTGDVYLRGQSVLRDTGLNAELGLWTIWAFTLNGATTGYGYKNGVSSAAQSYTTAVHGANIYFGADVQNGTGFLDGQIAAVLVYNTVKTAPQITAITKELAQRMWDYRGIRVNVATTNYTVAPIHTTWLAEVQEWLWAKLLPVPGGVR